AVGLLDLALGVEAAGEERALLGATAGVGHRGGGGALSLEDELAAAHRDVLRAGGLDLARAEVAVVGDRVEVAVERGPVGGVQGRALELIRPREVPARARVVLELTLALTNGLARGVERVPLRRVHGASGKRCQTAEGEEL